MRSGTVNKEQEIIKVLLVEDDHGVARLIKRMLSDEWKNNFLITHTEGLEEAFKSITTESLDIILLDLNLSDSKGLNTLRKMKDRKINVPIVVLTGIEDDIIRIKAVKEGAQDYLNKDRINRDILVRSIVHSIERYRMQLKIQESEEKHRALVNYASDAIVLSDMDGKILEWNKKGEELFGYTKKEVLNKHFTQFLPAEMIEKTVEVFQKVLKKGSGYLKDGKGLRKDGVTFPIDITASVIEYTDKKVVQAIIRDISERRNAENEIMRLNKELESKVEERTKELSESEERFREISNSAQDAIVMMDNKGNISFWNRAAEKIFGYKIKDAIGKELHYLIIPERYYEFYKKGLSGFMNTGHGPVIGKTLELEALKKDGKEFPVELSISVIKIKGKYNAIGIIRDITERKHMEEELRKLNEGLEINVNQRTSELAETVERLKNEIAVRKEVEERLELEHKLVQTLMDNIPDSIYFKDKKNRFVQVSRSKAERSGTDIKNMLNKTDFDFLPKSQAKKSFSDDNLVMKSGKAIKDKTEKLTGLNGAERWVSTTKIPWYDKDGEILGTIGISRDITGRKKAEESLDKQRKKFISVLIHDLKGPLLPVLGYTRRLIEGKAKSEDDKLRMLNILQKSSNELLKIIEDYSKDLRDAYELKSYNPQQVDFNKVLLLIVQNVFPEIEDRGIRLYINNWKKENWNKIEKVTLTVDPYQLKSLIENLLGNAIKYTRSIIRIRLKRIDDYIYFVISDDGPGIPRKFQEKIFEEYFQLPKSKKGTGIGLYSVKRVLENHKGDITVDSSIGKGASFKVKLPV